MIDFLQWFTSSFRAFAGTLCFMFSLAFCIAIIFEAMLPLIRKRKTTD